MEGNSYGKISKNLKITVGQIAGIHKKMQNRNEILSLTEIKTILEIRPNVGTKRLKNIIKQFLDSKESFSEYFGVEAKRRHSPTPRKPDVDEEVEDTSEDDVDTEVEGEESKYKLPEASLSNKKSSSGNNVYTYSTAPNTLDNENAIEKYEPRKRATKPEETVETEGKVGVKMDDPRLGATTCRYILNSTCNNPADYLFCNKPCSGHYIFQFCDSCIKEHSLITNYNAAKKRRFRTGFGGK